MGLGSNVTCFSLPCLVCFKDSFTFSSFVVSSEFVLAVPVQSMFERLFYEILGDMSIVTLNYTDMTY